MVQKSELRQRRLFARGMAIPIQREDQLQMAARICFGTETSRPDRSPLPNREQPARVGCDVQFRQGHSRTWSMRWFRFAYSLAEEHRSRKCHRRGKGARSDGRGGREIAYSGPTTRTM